MSADLNDLKPEFRAKVTAGLAALAREGLQFKPYFTLRNPVIQAGLWRQSRSVAVVQDQISELQRLHCDFMVECFAKAGATNISFHPEATQHVDRTIQHIRDSGCKPGLVFNPATPLNWLDHVIDKIDLVLLMSVNPGFGGQKFIPEAMPKLSLARARIEASGRDIRLEIDGGVKIDNAAAIAKAGADTFVAGSAIFGSADYAKTIRSMREQIDIGRRSQEPV